MPSHLYDKAYFTDVAYPGGYRDFPQHDVRFGIIMHLAHPKSLIDIGCAYGFMVKRALDKGMPAMGVDVSEWAEEQASRILPKGHFIRCNIEHGLPIKDLEYDCLYSEGVLEHISEDKIDFVLSEMGRVANTRVLAISFEGDAKGHLCMHDAEWWKERIPAKTWLYVGRCSTDVSPDKWYFKRAK
uniref:Putative methyltransferase n=1 Tax=viral metagenome TaxID=1070528 RepID=A0A6M3IXB1_9ZZZZ